MAVPVAVRAPEVLDVGGQRLADLKPRRRVAPQNLLHSRRVGVGDHPVQRRLRHRAKDAALRVPPRAKRFASPLAQRPRILLRHKAAMHAREQREDVRR